MDFKTEYKRLNDLVNQALEGYVAERDVPQADIYKAMRYSLMAGGKRLRPVLALAVCELLGGCTEDVMPYACAIEMIHTYSLIHDDLPAMDNDDYRRGLPTSHKIYGEAVAILAGDALLNRAFETMLGHSIKRSDRLPERIRAIGIIASAAGAEGMIAGQIVDLESEGKRISPDTLEYMHKCKTGALIKAPVLSAAVLCGADSRQYDLLEEYAGYIGLAFQIKDDIMDVEGNLKDMGKEAGSDKINGKATFVTLFGIDESGRKLDMAIEGALDSLSGLEGNTETFSNKGIKFLKELALYIKNRSN